MIFLCIERVFIGNEVWAQDWWVGSKKVKILITQGQTKVLLLNNNFGKSYCKVNFKHNLEITGGANAPLALLVSLALTYYVVYEWSLSKDSLSYCSCKYGMQGLEKCPFYRSLGNPLRWLS